MTTAAWPGTRLRRRVRGLGRLAAVFAGFALLVLALAGPAAALSTKTFGLTATGEETAVIVPAGAGTVTEHFDIYSLSHHPITVALGLQSVTVAANGSQVSSPQRTGLAADLQLPAHDVRLAAGQRRSMPLVVRRPGRNRVSEYAEITAMQVSPAAPPASAPLTLIVVLEPDTALGPATPSDTWHLAGLAIAGALASGGLVAQFLTRRGLRATLPVRSPTRAHIAR